MTQTIFATKVVVVEKQLQTEDDYRLRMITPLCCTNSRSLKFLSEGLPTSLFFSPKSYPKYHHNIRVATVEVTEAFCLSI